MDEWRAEIFPIGDFINPVEKKLTEWLNGIVAELSDPSDYFFLEQLIKIDVDGLMAVVCITKHEREGT